ncbi:MAG: lipid-A-disaccharide synthase [Acidobacteriota bacterium]
MKILISAGEASGDLYASRVAEILKQRHPEWELFGCAGPRMQAAGVRAVIDQRSLAVIGIVEVIAHIPRIYGLFKKVVKAAEVEKPDLAILTDYPSFHLKLAKKLKRMGVPVLYLIAPQAWAWRAIGPFRGGRVIGMRKTIDRLLCIFPFEERFYNDRGVPTTYIGHPLARLAKPQLSRAELCQKLGIPESSRIVAVAPGSRTGEIARHMGTVIEAVKKMREQVDFVPVLAVPKGFESPDPSFWEPIRAASIHTISGLTGVHTWDVLAHAELALVKSGTVAVEAAMLGTPMVTFYRVNALSWYLGRWMVVAPFLSGVNMVAGRRVVAELIQQDMTAESIAKEGLRLMLDAGARSKMLEELRAVAQQLSSEHDPMEAAGDWAERVLAGRETR